VRASVIVANPGYDPVRDFAAISLVSRTPMVLVVSPSVPVRSVAELVALAAVSGSADDRGGRSAGIRGRHLERAHGAGGDAARSQAQGGVKLGGNREVDARRRASEYPY
jgi:tripartite-type tricarboxylate transporter receptor subunit TctC